MVRVARRVAVSGFYHVVLRGCGKQYIFDDDADRWRFYDLMKRELVEKGITILAWCFMSNHVHLLVLDESRVLSEAMRNLSSSYALYFNRRSGHVGHLFQERFGSFPIEGEGYLLEVVHYIHDNPQHAGLCDARQWFWSSYREYVGRSEVSDTALVLELAGGRDGFVSCSAAYGEMTHCFEGRRRVPEDDARAVAKRALGGTDSKDVKTLERGCRVKALVSLRATGLSVRQIERLTGIGAKAITRLTR